MRIIAFVDDPAAVGKILDHIGESRRMPVQNRRLTAASGVSYSP